MTFGRARLLPDLNISIDGVVIKRVSTFKYLGLVLDESLSFKQHIEHVKKKIRPFIPLMWRKAKFISIDKRKQLYFAYVESNIAYMLPIYSVGSKKKLLELQRIQNRCIKALYHLHRFTPSTFLYSTSVLPVEKLAVVERITYMHKIINSLTKNNFDVRFNHETHSHSTRQSNQLHCSDKHPALMQSMIEYNRFCGGLRHLTSIKSFRDRIKFDVMKGSDRKYNVISPYVFLN